jgi:NAD(P)-dependent dehydrogenase (short-subunit alcohol dehydrogenase family)
VIGTGRNVEALSLLKANGDVVDFIVADVTSPGACQRIVDQASERLGGLTTVVNAAGILKGGPMGDVDMKNYALNMSTNCQAPFEIMVHAIPHLKKQKELSPSIVNVSSVNGKQAFASCVAYCMSKAAVDQLTRCASVDLAKDGIRVNAVNPGVIETNIHKVILRLD